MLMEQTPQTTIRTKPTILCVDDHQDSRTLLAFLLAQEGYSVLVAEGFADARRLADRVQFDLFILDVRLPDGCGIELCRDLATLCPGTPVVFCSGLGDDEDIKRARDAGGALFLRKPVSPSELKNAVDDILAETLPIPQPASVRA